ncbi:MULTISPECIES: Crp/Fnr family transcriptional regulator [unclassified Chryseobacterium]|uniref:Crp/Fnr family transcriptional regulator n=1 Tax=unclassified Chryseobacterium TaxID=2593645 RepID=UPI001E2AA4DF|nr:MULTISPECIES: Crp/Fnr family transcriptional regulator [unclassified Chryseobacterium]
MDIGFTYDPLMAKKKIKEQKNCEMTDVFENYLSSTGGFSAEEIHFSAQFFKPIHLKKGDFFIQEDELCRYVGFIASGAVKAYAIDNEGKENITCFKFENEFATSFPEFVRQEKSRRSIRAIEDSVIYRINFQDYQHLLNQVSVWNEVIKLVMEKEYSQKEGYLLNYNNKSTVDKYHYVLSNEPMLVQRVTTQDLAAYLGITQRSLTRAKGQIHKPNVL